MRGLTPLQQAFVVIMALLVALIWAAVLHTVGVL